MKRKQYASRGIGRTNTSPKPDMIKRKQEHPKKYGKSKQNKNKKITNM